MQHLYYFISAVTFSFLINDVPLSSQTMSLNAFILGLNRYLWWQSWQRVVEPELWRPCTLTFSVCRNWMSWTVSHTSLVYPAQHGKTKISKVFVRIFYMRHQEMISRVVCSLLSRKDFLFLLWLFLISFGGICQHLELFQSWLNTWMVPHTCVLFM